MEMLGEAINSFIYQLFIKHLPLPGPVLEGKTAVGTFMGLTVLEKYEGLIVIVPLCS